MNKEEEKYVGNPRWNADVSKNKVKEETEELRKVNPSFNAGYERAFAEVKTAIDEAEKTTGFIGIGEWDTDNDIDRVYTLLKKLKQRLGLKNV